MSVSGSLMSFIKLPYLSVNMIPLYFLHEADMRCIIDINSAGMGNMVQLFLIIHLPYKLRK